VARPRIIAVAGGSGSGKTTFAKALARAVGASILSQDSYYIDQSDRFKVDGGDEVNFDHPDSLDWPLLEKHLAELRAGRAIEEPIYDFPTHRRLGRTETVRPAPIILLDGILILSRPELRPLFDDSVFLDIPEEIRFKRRFDRDVVERNRSAEGVRRQIERQVKPMHDLYVQPSVRYAKRVIHNDQEFDQTLKVLQRELSGGVSSA
jgi:uridine kinase